ncbi:acetate--CoA ligase family protein [Sediminicurvatus halobius]|uniref:CoA-binding protein n=1 Tax=Sediminicurvatus halobius TaxID=2182432 RepID=A0A2U2N9P5_9GAMM|nr:acetate--CoA ligase family protein [Spiribacter halobius]PWG65817.1 CoA-binding protein [Spiribacter halobius]UEX77859.1 acetate--CoA ligase family protein [Spiribacter halobius]
MTETLDPIAAARRAGRSALSEAAGKRLLDRFGVQTPWSVVVDGPDEVANALVGREGPFVVKVVSPDILHKSDVGGVALDLADADAVAGAMRAMAGQLGIRSARVEGYLVEEMLPAGQELVVGAVRDPYFGPLLMVGLGGVFVEVMQDVAFRICPVTRDDAFAMLDELRGAAVLDGARGGPPASREAIVDVLLRLGGPEGLLMQSGDELQEVDVNPLIVSRTGAVAADARFILRADAPPAGQPASMPGPEDAATVLERFTPLFEPKAIGVLGASTSSATMANTFIRRMRDFGYAGGLYPIHPKAGEIEGLKAYPSLAEAPEPIDYAYIALGASRVPEVLAGAAGRVRFAQVLSSGFAEVPEGEALEQELVAAARAGGVRVIGPNCLGLYSPRGRVTFPVNPPETVGSVGVISQSGGLGTDIIKRGQWRGLTFSGVVTVGNSADIGPVDLLEYYFADPQTRVIGLYLEGIRDGQRLFRLLRSQRAGKPVVILKGGRSAQGNAAAASHTGALAGDQRAWEALCRQTPCTMVSSLETFIDALLAFQNLTLRPQRPTRNVVLFGNGGGTGVLATDYFAERGLDIRPFEAATRESLEALALPPGTSVANPIDTPVATLQQQDGWVAGEILDRVYATSQPDAIVMHLNLAAFVGRGDSDPVDNLIQVAEHSQTRHPGRAHFLLVLRSDGSPQLDDIKRKYRERALAVGIPVYDEVTNAADALAQVQQMEERLAAGASPDH